MDYSKMPQALLRAKLILPSVTEAEKTEISAELEHRAAVTSQIAEEVPRPPLGDRLARAEAKIKGVIAKETPAPTVSKSASTVVEIDADEPLSEADDKAVKAVLKAAEAESLKLRKAAAKQKKDASAKKEKVKTPKAKAAEERKAKMAAIKAEIGDLKLNRCGFMGRDIEFLVNTSFDIYGVAKVIGFRIDSRYPCYSVQLRDSKGMVFSKRLRMCRPLQMTKDKYPQDYESIQNEINLWLYKEDGMRAIKNAKYFGMDILELQKKQIAATERANDFLKSEAAQSILDEYDIPNFNVLLFGESDV